MDVAVISGLIDGVGFPIAVCVALFWSNRETVKHYEKILLEFRNTLDNNTHAMEQLFNRLDGK